MKVRKNLTTRKSFCNVLDNATMATVHQLSLPTTPPLRYISPKHADPEKKNRIEGPPYEGYKKYLLSQTRPTNWHQVTSAASY